MNSRRTLILATLAAVTVLGGPVYGDVVFAPVKGYIHITTLSVECPSQPVACFTCINDEATTADNRLMIALGETYPAVPTTGSAIGVVMPFVDVDGVRLTPDLLPCGAFFRFGVSWSDLPLATNCSGALKGVTYQIGPFPEATVSGDGSTQYDLPAEDAIAVPFEFSLCSQFVYWGAGCNVSGSSQHGWKLHTPGELHALQVGPGDSPGAGIAASEFAVDFESSPGGVLSVSRVAGDPPGTPPVPHLNGYWDVHTDMPVGSYVAQVSLNVDPSALPEGVTIAEVKIAAYDPDAGSWDVLPTTPDEAVGVVRANTAQLTKFVLLDSPPVPVEHLSWGAVKAIYR